MSSLDAARRELPKSLTDHAVSEIRGMILRGELAEGERLIETSLTEALGVSRPPLREALRILEAEGLIATEARRGSRVISLSDQDVYEVLTLRASLERLAVELGVQDLDERRLRRLRDAMTTIEERAAAGDRPGVVTAGYEFHSAVVALPGHSRLRDAYESVHLQQLLWTTRSQKPDAGPSETLAHNAERHRILFEAIAGGDRDLALRALAAHDDNASTPSPGDINI